MTRVALLDVNVLVALFDPDHRGIPVAAVVGADRGTLEVVPA